MFLREDTLRVKVAEGHVQYLREILEWTEFTKRVFVSLDLSVNEVETTILDRGLTNVNFEHSLMLDEERARMLQDGGGVLGSWLRSLLSAEGSLLLLFNPMAEKQDKAIRLKPYRDVFYYHDRVLDADKVVHVVFPGASEDQILKQFSDAETSDILFAGVALRDVRFDKSELYNDMTHERLFELLDSATHLVFDICDGDASCLWPTRHATVC